MRERGFDHRVILRRERGRLALGHDEQTLELIPRHGAVLTRVELTGARAVPTMCTMANTGFFRRLSNPWRGSVSPWISDVEKKHPEIAYENAINSMIEKYTALKHPTAAIIRRREDIDARYKQK